MLRWQRSERNDHSLGRLNNTLHVGVLVDSDRNGSLLSLRSGHHLSWVDGVDMLAVSGSGSSLFCKGIRFDRLESSSSSILAWSAAWLLDRWWGGASVGSGDGLVFSSAIVGPLLRVLGSRLSGSLALLHGLTLVVELVALVRLFLGALSARSLLWRGRDGG